MAGFSKRLVHSQCDPGMVFQSQVTAVIMLVVAEKIQNYSIFELSCENLEGGAFDDIGLRFKPGSNSNISTRLFIQTKYTEDNTEVVSRGMLRSSTEKSAFRMTTYYDSYCNIIKNAKNVNKKRKDQLILVLCTNRSLHTKVQKSMRKNLKINKTLDHIFKLLSVTHYKFKKTQTVMEDFQHDGLKKFLPKFFDSFILACETIDKVKLANKIECLLNEMSLKLLKYELWGNPSEKRAKLWVDLVRDWINEKQASIINENDIKLLFIYNTLLFDSISHESSFQKQGGQTVVKWEEQQLYKDLMVYFARNEVKVIKSHEDSFLVLKILHTFKKQQNKLSKHLFLKGSDYRLIKQHALHYFFEVNEPFLLVIDFTDSSMVREDITSSNNFVETRHAKVMITIEKKKESLFQK